MPDAKILYLHGFRSSPDSFKARLMAQAMADLGRERDWACPALPASPRAAAILARETSRPCWPARRRAS